MRDKTDRLKIFSDGAEDWNNFDNRSHTKIHILVDRKSLIQGSQYFKPTIFSFKRIFVINVLKIASIHSLPNPKLWRLS